MTDLTTFDLTRAPERALFAHVGEALFGTQWQRSMARELDVSERSVRYWVAGTYPVPKGVWNDIDQMLRKRGDELRNLREHIPA